MEKTLEVGTIIKLEELYKQGWTKVGYYADCYVMENNNQKMLYSYVKGEIIFKYFT